MASLFGNATSTNITPDFISTRIWQDKNFGGGLTYINPATGKRDVWGRGTTVGGAYNGDAQATPEYTPEGFLSEFPTYNPVTHGAPSGPDWLDKLSGPLDFIGETIADNPFLLAAGPPLIGTALSGGFGTGAGGGLSGYEGMLAGQDALAGSTMINSGALGSGALAGGSGTDLLGAANDVATNAFDSGGMPDYSSPDFNTTNFPEYNPDVPNMYNSASTASGGNLQSIIEQVTKTPGGSSLVSRFLSGNATTADYVSAGGKLLATALGLVGSSSAAKSSTELANKFAEFGAPYRAQLANISTNPDAFYKGPQATSALEAVLRRLSVGGNPAGDPYKQSLAVNSLYGEYGRERDRLAGFGGLTAYSNAAPGAMTAAASGDKGIYDALGYGINALTNPQSSLEELYAKIKAMGGSSLTNALA